MIIEYKTKDSGANEVNVKLSWYYISPCEIILTVEPSGSISSVSSGDLTFAYNLGLDWANLTFLDSTAREGVVHVSKESPPRFSILLNDYLPHPDEWDGIRYRFHAKLTTDDHFKLYPMKVLPEPGKTYPIIT